MGGFLETVGGAFIPETSVLSPCPTWNPCGRRGIAAGSDESYAAAVPDDERRRRLLAALLADDGWAGEDWEHRRRSLHA